MKKIFIFAAILTASLMVISCGKVRTYPTGALGYNAGGTDTATYPFETAADVAEFSLSGSGFTDKAFTTEEAYSGNGCVKLTCLFNAPNVQGRLALSNVTFSTLTGKTITAHIWVPAGMFLSNNPDGAFLYLQLGSLNNNDWYQSTWQNLSLPGGSVGGIWNTISASVDSMTLQNGNGSTGHVNGYTFLQNNVTTTAQTVTWGVVVGQGGTSQNYTGSIYIDSVNIE